MRINGNYEDVTADALYGRRQAFTSLMPEIFFNKRKMFYYSGLICYNGTGNRRKSLPCP